MTGGCAWDAGGSNAKEPDNPNFVLLSAFRGPTDAGVVERVYPLFVKPPFRGQECTMTCFVSRF